ncbi:MAG: ABC transporter ATP-binding protein [Acidobacteriota bacterium]|nr:ABC transporter ATP-binding protein [Acidobacteriota bacterium]
MTIHDDAPATGTPGKNRGAPGVASGDIKCREIFKWFGSSLIIEDLNLDIAHNEFVCVVGPSGCGKTTLLRMIAGLTDIDNGSIEIGGTRVTKPLATVGVVFQQFGLFPWKTVLRNVALPMRAAGVSKEEAFTRAREAIELVGLKGSDAKYPAQLSGGMKQRAGLARALAIRPEVILLDEPFAAVDAQTREILQEELLNLWGRHKQTAVFITHSIDEAITLADRVIVMGAHPGRVVKEIPIPIERPRTVASVRRDPLYPSLREEIWDLLRIPTSTPKGQ